MPIYVFEDMDTGQVVERLMRHDEVCSIGEWMTIDGVPCVRLAAAPVRNRSTTQTGRTLVSNALPTKAALERIMGEDGKPLRAPAYDELGRAVFKTDEQVREFVKRSGGRYVWSKDYDGPTTTDERIEQEKTEARERVERDHELAAFRMADMAPGSGHDQAMARAVASQSPEAEWSPK